MQHGSYLRPDRLAEAVTALAGGGRVVLAGGTDLYPATSRGSLAGDVVDVSGVRELRAIARDAGGLRIGAATTWAEIAGAALPPACDGLRAAARLVGGIQVQNRATIGGNLCNASPAADGVPPLLVLDASVELASVAGTRRVPLADFLHGPRRTGLRPGELVTAVSIPGAALAGVSAFTKLGSRRNLVISIAMVAARLVVGGGRIAAAALAVGACGPAATRLPAVEAALTGARPGPEASARIDTRAVAAALAPIGDVRASAEYRPEAAAELLRRTVAALAGAGP